ncbi:PHD finger protein 14-like isoform X2 [Pecten maximus]|uniref:PHD finger protein 14-like isoform X2 n=1 Tax=Pecten maximus TaxID=6579 RepID=UPI00145919CB|nr:PHD finger protein 14-like isoform X2 [Pecten maximus]
MTTARSTGSPTSASKIRTRLANNKVSDSNESDGEKSTPRGGHLELVPRDRKLPPLERTSEQENTEVKRLKKKKQKKNKKQKDENEQVKTNDIDNTAPLPNQVAESSSHSGNMVTLIVSASNKPELTDQEPDSQPGIVDVTTSENTEQKPNMEPGNYSRLSVGPNTQPSEETQEISDAKTTSDTNTETETDSAVEKKEREGLNYGASSRQSSEGNTQTNTETENGHETPEKKSHGLKDGEMNDNTNDNASDSVTIF